ncbi:hypothetical protein ACVWXO_008241 [Bradyrhizobium sp. LM2.7]
MERSGYSSVATAHDRSMKMLDLAPNIQQGCIRGVNDFE